MLCGPASSDLVFFCTILMWYTHNCQLHQRSEVWLFEQRWCGLPFLPLKSLGHTSMRSSYFPRSRLSPTSHGTIGLAALVGRFSARSKYTSAPTDGLDRVWMQEMRNLLRPSRRCFSGTIGTINMISGSLVVAVIFRSAFAAHATHQPQVLQGSRCTMECCAR